MKYILNIILLLSLSFSSFAIQGDGTINNPFQLNNLSDFLLFRDTVNSGYFTACAELNTDIDLKEVCFKDSIRDTSYHWFSIAGLGDGTSYQGRFNGNGYIIRNLFIQSHIESNRGVFGNISNAVILNLGVENVFMIAGYNIGGIAGTAKNSVISNCFVTGHIEGYFLGGIVGMAENCRISNCYCSCFVDGNYPGYVSGYNINTSLSHCFYNKNIECNGIAHESIGMVETSMYNGDLREKLNNYIVLHGGDSLVSWCQTEDERTLPQYHCSTPSKTPQSEIVKIYTNHRSLYFQLSRESKIEIFDFQGRLHISKKYSQGKHNISTLPPGNYVLNGRKFQIRN